MSITIQIERISPSKAKYYLSKNLGNRTLNERTVQSYISQMQKGQWMLSPQGISFDLNGNLIDGQHRLKAIELSGFEFDFIITRGLDPEVFKVLDIGKNRTAGDLLSIENIKNGNAVATIVKKFILLRRGSTETDASGKRTHITSIDILNEYNKYPTIFQKAVLKSSALRYKLNIFPISYVGAVLCYLIIEKGHSRELVERFLEGLHTYSENSTVNLLRERMIKNKVAGVKEKNSIVNALVIKAWNSFLSNDNKKMLKYVDSHDYPEFK